MTGGISQRAPELAGPDTWRELINFIPEPGVGLTRRPHTEFHNLVLADLAPDMELIPLDFGGTEKYVALVGHQDIKVYRPGDPTAFPVYVVTRDAAGAITGGTAADFTYLSLRRRQLLPNPESFSGWALTGDMATVTPGSGSQRVPLDLPDIAGGGDEEYLFTLLQATSAGPSTTGGISEQVNLNLSAGIRKISVFVDAPGVLLSTIALKLRDTAHASNPVHSVTWDINSGSVSVPTVDTNASDFRTFLETFDGGDSFRIGFIYDPARASAEVSTGNVTNVEIELSTTSGTLASHRCWGALLAVEGRPDTIESYHLPAHILRWVTAGETTYITNPLTATRMESTVTDAEDDVLGLATFTGVGAGIDETGIQVADMALLWIRQTFDGAVAYSVDIQIQDTTGGGGTVTITASDTITANDSTATIAAAIVTAINGHASNTDSGTGGNEAQIINATQLASTILLVTKQNDGENWEIVRIRTTDPHGGLGFVSIHDKVASLADLPPRGSDGFRVQLSEGITEIEDTTPRPDVYLKFVSQGGLTGSSDEGVWEETVGYGLQGTPDGDTLPHALIRRQDDASGTVTGQASAIYFEWATLDWDARSVGDALTNAIPSCITPPDEVGLKDRFVDSVGWHQDRLMLASQRNVVFSRVGLPANLWRSTVRTVVDSDRIDVAWSAPDSSTITDIVSADARTFLRSQRTVAEVITQETLSASTLALETVHSGESGELARTAPGFGGLFLDSGSDRREELTFLQPVGQAFVPEDLSKSYPTLIPAPLHTLVWAEVAKTLFVWSKDDDPSRILGVKFPTAGQPRENAPFFLEFTSEVHALGVVGDELFVVVARDDTSPTLQLNLESICLDRDLKETGQDWSPALDRRVTNEDLDPPPSFSSPNTTFTLPYTIEDGPTMKVIRRDSANYGEELTIVTATVGGSTVVVSGDHSSTDVFIGSTFRSLAIPTPPLARVQQSRQTGEVDIVPLPATRVTVKQAAVQVVNTGYLELLLANLALGTTTPAAEGDKALVDVRGSDGELSALVGRGVRFGIGRRPEDTELRIVNSSVLPTRIGGLSWIVEVARLQ